MSPAARTAGLPAGTDAIARKQGVGHPMGPESANGSSSFDWLLQNLLTATPGIRHVMVLSRDGLKLSHTTGLTTDQADHLAAIASGVQSLALSASALFSDAIGTGQAMVEFRGGLLLIVPAGEGAHLAVIAEDDADVGLVGHNMSQLVEQMGAHLTAPPRLPRLGGPGQL